MNITNKNIEAEIFNFNIWIKITNPSKLKSICLETLEKSGYLSVGFLEHYFPNGGYTALWLLAESHLAIHSFPDENKTYLELSGCNQEKTKIFSNEIEKYK